jgi:hypothetical protein
MTAHKRKRKKTTMALVLWSDDYYRVVLVDRDMVTPNKRYKLERMDGQDAIGHDRWVTLAWPSPHTMGAEGHWHCLLAGLCKELEAT